jgi:hypothetical protein
VKFHQRVGLDHPELIKVGMKMSDKAHNITEEKSGRQGFSSARY